MAGVTVAVALDLADRAVVVVSWVVVVVVGVVR